MKRLLQLTILLGALVPWLVQAGGDEVVVIYNSRVPESKAIAEHYAQMRQVPQSQIYGFSLTTREEISRDEFRDSLQLPLAKKLEADKLWRFGSFKLPAANGQPARTEIRVVTAKIRYAVLCYGVPLNIQPDADLHENIPANVRPELQRNEAAVDSELTWLPLVKNPVPLYGPLPNPFYGITNATLLNPTNGILLVARLDGPTADIARALVDKALQAETNGLWGRAYFDARGLNQPDTNYFLGDEWMRGAAQLSRELGFETTLDNQPETFPASFPLSHIAIYAGWYTENANGPFALPTVEFMPGAFAYHLHSYSAATLRSTTRNWCGPLLAKGATVTMGCVNEPYLAATPNVPVFISRWIAGDFTFGEAAWAAQPVLSWQTTVVGDPLYRPFGRTLQRLHAQLVRDHSPLAEWSFLRLVNLERNHGVSLAQTAQNLETLQLTAQSAVLTEKLADIYDELGKPASAIYTYQQALNLNPSPQQRLRLRLTLGDKLLAQGRTADAIENYHKLLAEDPDYPGKAVILNKLAALEPKTAADQKP
jgi:uncharacterized protein (TIGR03790 family)